MAGTKPCDSPIAATGDASEKAGSADGAGSGGYAPAPGRAGAPPPPRRPRVRILVVRLLGYAGFALFVFLIVKTGPKEILRALGRLSLLEIAALMGLRILYWLIRALNWRALLIASGARPPLPG